MTIEYVAIACSLALLISLCISLQSEHLGRVLDVMDRPNAARKRHARPIPMVAGVATVPAVVGVFLMLAVIGEHIFYVIAALTSFAFLLGFVDDRMQVSARARLTLSGAATFALFLLAPDLALKELQLTFLWPHTIFLGHISGLFITVMILVGFQNAVNMADGKDGLVSGICLLWCGFLAYAGPLPVTIAAIVLAFALTPAFIFNLAGRQFLGDSGSYGLAVALGCLALYGHNLGEGTMPADLVALWFLVPVLDSLRVMAKRLAGGESPMMGDLKHFHHRLHNVMPWRYGLCVYLGIVGAPGIIALIFSKFTFALFILTVVVYKYLLVITSQRSVLIQQQVGLGEEG